MLPLEYDCPSIFAYSAIEVKAVALVLLVQHWGQASTKHHFPKKTLLIALPPHSFIFRVRQEHWRGWGRKGEFEYLEDHVRSTSTKT